MSIWLFLLSNLIFMKRILVLFVLGALSYSALAQNELTVERIWKSGEFSQKGVDGFTSLADGEHFTKIVQESGST